MFNRLQAFDAAGADVLYAPGLTTLDEVRAVTTAFSRPVNVLAPLIEGATVAALAEAGATRLSIGGALARAATTVLLSAGAEMRDRESFGWSANLVAGSEVTRLLTSESGRLTNRSDR